MPQFITTSNGIFRADAWEDRKKEQERLAARRKELYKADSFSVGQMLRKVVDKSSDFQHEARLDANETNFIARQLLHIMAGVKETRYPGDILEDAFIINPEGGAGLIAIGYEQLDFSGAFKRIGTTARDLPEVGTKQTEHTTPVGVFGAAAGWSQIELERAGKSGTPLNARKMQAAMLAAKKTKNSIAWNGDGEIKGLFSYALNEATIVGTWGSATADAILTDMRAFVNECREDTEDFEVDTIVMDPASYSYMTARLSNTDTTVGEFVMSKLGVSRILYTSYLTSVTSAVNSISAERVMVGYPRNSLVAEFMLPRDVQQMPIRQDGLHYYVPMLMDTAGLFAYMYGSTGPIVFATGM